MKPPQGSLSLSCCYCTCPPNAATLFSVCFLSIALLYVLSTTSSSRTLVDAKQCETRATGMIWLVWGVWSDSDVQIMLSGILARPGDLQLENHVEHPIWAVRLQQLHNVGVLQHVTDAGLPLQIWKHTQKNRDQERKKGRWAHMTVRRAHNSMNAGLTQIILTLRKECLLDIA